MNPEFFLAKCSEKRGGHGPQCRAAPSKASPLGGQRITRSEKRGGHFPPGRPKENDNPLGGQRITRSEERGGL